jgi:hypothetical protein
MMKQQILNRIATATLFLTAFAASARAQENFPLGPSNAEHDFQFFEPLELDLDNMPAAHPSGYSFEYNKLFWSYSGERVTVGSPNVEAFAEVIYPDNAGVDQGDPPPPHQIFNTLEDVPPKAGFAFGNRYELGYRDKDNGWMLGILDGPELNQTEIYGFARDAATGGGLPPFIDPDYTGPDDIGPGGGPVVDFRAFGFGSVPILFETPVGYLFGFRDYLNFLSDAFIGTQGGPLLYIGNYGGQNEVDIDDTIPFFRIADDLDEDGIAGAELVLVIGPDGIARIATIRDFDDLHQFNIFFDSVAIRNTTETDGVELMWSHALTHQHYQAKNHNNEVTVSWGARYFKLYDEFRVDAFGSILHDAFWDTSFINQIVGPQVAVKWTNQRQRWRLQADGRFMFGYNVADWDQIGLTGFGMVPGALNQPLHARPTAFSHGLQEQEFSPVAELRVHAAYSITSGLSLKAGYTGAFVGNIRRAAPSVHYSLPDMGYLDAGTQNLLINGFDLGVEFVH